MRNLILGGPGCGKTTYLIDIVKQAIAEGTLLRDIGYFAFTRKAAQEARDRLLESCSDFTESDAYYFCTIHAFVFRQLGLSRGQVISDNLLKDITKSKGYEITGSKINFLKTTDDLSLDAINKADVLDSDAYQISQDMDISPKRAMKLLDDIESYKASNGMSSYNDMLRKFVERGNSPHFDILIVDEAQDLTKLQWNVIEKVAEKAKEVYFAGDDDQAIYRWSGADVEYFTSLEAKKYVLPKSHRLPKRVFNVCNQIIKDVELRYKKDWKPRNEDGKVVFIDDISRLDFRQGQWLLLARNLYLLNSATDHLFESGISYITQTKDGWYAPYVGEEITAVLLWERARKDFINGDQANMILPFLDIDKKFDVIDRVNSEMMGSNDPWDKALKLKPKWIRYIKEMKANGFSLAKRPDVLCSTIHASKGGESENVVVFVDMSKTTYEKYIDNEDDENRVFFVACSRAKKNLYIVDPKTKRYCRLNGLVK